ncbi:hypothetical protein GQ42DRAFT_129202, partial [Ramicandelaber brevisporus]
PEGGITRAHWQPAGPNAVCSHPGCGRALSAGLALGRPHNCHRCGRLMCEQHCSQRLRLAPNASHDAARGQWAPVCTQCFGAAQPHLARQQATAQQPGQTRSRTAELARLKAAASTQLLLETNRLEKRLEKLASALQVPTQHRPQRTFFVANQRQLEQSVVAWEPDSVASCRVCSSAFGVFTSRRHHCRLCGMCVCGRAECSTSYLVSNDVPVFTPTPRNTGVMVRFCSTCIGTLCRRQEKLMALLSPPRYVTLYQQLLGARADIERMLPRFTELVGSFGRAMAMRRQLQDAFAQYDATAKAIARLPVASASSSSARMYSNIYNAAVMYMQARMVPLNVLPRMLHESTQQQKAQRQQSSDGGDASASSDAASAEKRGAARQQLTEAERLEAMQMVQVLREQRTQVAGFVAEAVKHRRLEDAQTLQLSLDELDGEISRIAASLS